MQVPLARRWIVIALAVLFCSGLGGVAASDRPALSGLIKDTLGKSLHDVEVLLIERAKVTTPVAVVRSDADGTFRIAQLPAGDYRIAALKQGYLTFVGRVDTGVQRWVDVVLHPLPELQGELPNPIPEKASWGYRLPRRYLLEDVDEEPIRRSAEMTMAHRAVAELVHLRLDQSFALTGGHQGDTGDSGLHGSSTEVEIGSLIGSKANLVVAGHRNRLDSQAELDEESFSASHDTSAVRLGFSYDTSPDAKLAMNAYYGEADVRLARETLAEEILSADTHGQRYWGYEAEWSKQLDPGSRIAVAVDYQDNRLTIPKTKLAFLEGELGEGDLTNRTVGASGSYDSRPATDHRLKVDFQAKLLEAPSPGLRPTVADVPLRFEGISGLSLGLQAQDTWSVAGPFSVVYGLGYKHSVSSRDTSLIVPQLGGAWQLQDLAVRFLASYHGVTDWSAGSSLPEEQTFRLADRWGYDASVEAPLPAGLGLVAALRYSPIQLDFVGYSDARDGRRAPLFLTDGNAAVRERRLRLTHEAEYTLMRIELTRGDVQGMIAPVLPYAHPWLALSQSAMDYEIGSLGVRIHPSGTDIELEYQRLASGAADAPTLDASAQRALEIRLIQDLLRLRSLGNWRLLMAVRTASLDTGESEPGRLSDEALLHSLNRQVSAGLSVMF